MMNNKFMHKYHHPKSYGLFVLRLGLGIIFMAHGLAKIHSMPGTEGFFASLGFGAGIAHFVAYTELIAGIAVILGIFTRVASAALFIIMSVVLLKVKAGATILGPNGAELEIALFTMSAALLFMGPGHLALGPNMCGCCRGGKCKGYKCPCHAFCDTSKCGSCNYNKCDGCDTCTKDGTCTEHEMGSVK